MCLQGVEGVIKASRLYHHRAFSARSEKWQTKEGNPRRIKMTFATLVWDVRYSRP